jgi:RNA polymerase sigma factor (sigma-70 family)
MNTSHAWKLEAALLPAAQPLRERATADRDAVSFDRLVAREHAYVARLVGRLVGWRGDVDDLVQDVFVAALGGWARFRGGCAARTWLSRIAINKCRSYGRRRWARQQWLALWQAQTATAESQEHPADQQETAEQVRHAIMQLRQRDREVIVLHYLEQMPPSDIAESLNLSRNAVEVRLTRARKRLKEILNRALEYYEHR